MNRRAFLADSCSRLHRPRPRGHAPPRRLRRRRRHVGAARRQAALRPEGQVRHLAVHERRRQPHGDLRPQADARPSTPARPSPRRRSRTRRTRRSSSSPASPSSTTPTASSGTSSTRSQVGFKKYGQSGIEVSDWLPHTGGVHRRHRRRPLDVHDRRQPRRPDAVPLRPAHARRRVPDARAPGSTTASARSTTTCRSSSRWATASTGTRRTATTSARRTTRCRSASIPANPLDYGKPEAAGQPRRAASSASTWSAS